MFRYTCIRTCILLNLKIFSHQIVIVEPDVFVFVVHNFNISSCVVVIYIGMYVSVSGHRGREILSEWWCFVSDN